MDRPLSPRPRRRRLAPLAGLLVVAALGVVGLRALTKPALASVEASAVQLDTVTRGPFVRQIEGPGVFEADGAIWLSAAQPGRVERVLVKAGAAVQAGEVLVELSNHDLRLAALEAELTRSAARGEKARSRSVIADATATREASIAALGAQLAEAQSRQAQATRLVAEGLETRAELLAWEAKSQEYAARLRVEQARMSGAPGEARAQLSPQEERVRVLDRIIALRSEQIAALSVRAQEAGVVQELLVEPGQWITSGTTLGKIIRPAALRVALQIPESLAGEVAPGQAVKIEISGAEAAGRVSRVAPSAKAGTVQVEVALAGPLPPGARPDARVHGAIEIATVQGALSIRRPPRAVPNGKTSLYRRTPAGPLAVVAVAFGAASASRIEILGGLAEGDVVAVSDMTPWEASESLNLR